MNKISLNPEVDCKTVEVGSEEYNANCTKVTAKELIDYYKKLIDFLNIDERDEIVLELLGKDSKYQEGVYHDYIKKKDEHELYSYYDLIFKRVMSDDQVRAADTTWFMTTLLRYVDSVHKRRGSTFIFPYPEEIEGIFKKYYVEWIEDYFQNNIEFLQEVKSQLEAGVEPFRYRYRLDHRVHMLGSSSDGPLDPLISNLIYGKFTGFTQQMDNETSRYFFSTFMEQRQEINSVVNGQP
ncbi:MAG: hypothetical protein HRT44_06460 [Bdellovibrionales bacterium]|nr:hypothetical protein [Bdellovibrionales bacterium]